MTQKFLTTIKTKDFINGVFTLTPSQNPIIKGYSAEITIKKLNNKIIISRPINEQTAYIKNFNFSLITNSNFICNINWEGINDTNKYRLYQNNSIIQTEVYNNFKIDFSNYQNGVYTFKLDCLEQNIFVKQGEHDYEYTYPFLTIPIRTNYKYYFYYGIENDNTDTFSRNLLTVTAIDSYGAQLIENEQSEELEEKHFFNSVTINALNDKDVLLSDEYLYFTDDDYTEGGYPPDYFILDLAKIPGTQGEFPDIQEIKIYIEEISEDEDDIEEDIGGDL